MHTGFGHRKVDDHIAAGRQLGCHGHTDLADARQFTRVLAESRTLGTFECQRHFQPRIRSGKCHNPLAHAACGSVNGDANGVGHENLLSVQSGVAGSSNLCGMVLERDRVENLRGRKAWS